MLKSLNSLTFAIIILFFSCSVAEKPKTQDIKWQYRGTNPYPSVMKEVKCDDDATCLIMELEPKSLKLDCTLRNDSPYYWCGVDGIIANKDPKLPERVETVFHTVMSIKTKTVAEQWVGNFRKSNKSIYLLISTRVFIDDDNAFTSKMYGIYNAEVCMDTFYNYSVCPKAAKKFDLFADEFVK